MVNPRPKYAFFKIKLLILSLSQRCQSVKLKKTLKVVKKTEISFNFVQIGLKMCNLALAKKLNSVLKLKTGISVYLQGCRRSFASNETVTTSYNRKFTK